MDLRKQFKKELHNSNIHYKHLVDENTLNLWFEQYSNTKKEPSVFLYLSKYFTDSEREKALEHNPKPIYEKRREYYEHLHNNTLEKEFYQHNIKQTLFYKLSDKIYDTVSRFHDRLNDEPNLTLAEPKRKAEIIIQRLEKLPLSFASRIIESIEKDSASMHVFIAEEFGGKKISKKQEILHCDLYDDFIARLNEWKENNSITVYNDNKQQHTINGKKIPAKYYALLHWIKIEMGTELPFARNKDDKLPKSKIIEFAKERYGKKFPAVEFYNQFKEIDITNKGLIARTFEKGFKEKLIKISDNDADIIHYLKDFPN